MTKDSLSATEEMEILKNVKLLIHQREREGRQCQVFYQDTLGNVPLRMHSSHLKNMRLQYTLDFYPTYWVNSKLSSSFWKIIIKHCWAATRMTKCDPVGANSWPSLCRNSLLLFADFPDFGLKALDKQVLCAHLAFPEVSKWKERRQLNP